MKHIMDEFQRVALAHPSIYFTLIHNGSENYNLPSSNYRQRIVNILGGRTNEKLVPVSEDTEIVTISGFVGKPEYAKKSRSEQFFFVNDRFIKSGYLHHAIMSAFDGLLKEGNQPSYFLYLKVKANEYQKVLRIDSNITKNFINKNIFSHLFFVMEMEKKSDLHFWMNQIDR